MSHPAGFFFAADGKLYVTSYNTDQVLRYDAHSGQFIDVFVTGGLGGLDGPDGATFGPDGNLYVTSADNNDVLRYNGQTGQFIDVFVPQDGYLSYPGVPLFQLAGTLAGTVRDANTGQPLVGASIITTGTTQLTANTDSTGAYTLTSALIGSYTVTASLAGYIPMSATVIVSAGNLTVQDFSLVSTSASTPTPSTTPIGTPTESSTGTPASTDTAIPMATSTSTPINPATNTPGLPTSTPTEQPTPSPTDCPNPFVDIQDNTFYGAIHALSCRRVVRGLDASHYGPSATSTRGQFARVVVKGFGLPITTPSGGGQSFTDVPPGYFAYNYVETGYAAGILSGYDQNSCQAVGANYPCYLPNRAITRAELTKLVVKTAGYPRITPTTGATFVDVTSTYFAYIYIETAYAHGIINGVDSTHFAPGRSIRRDEMAQIVFKGMTTP